MIVIISFCLVVLSLAMVLIIHGKPNLFMFQLIERVLGEEGGEKEK